jgi:hypothetical protein
MEEKETKRERKRERKRRKKTEREKKNTLLQLKSENVVEC